MITRLDGTPVGKRGVLAYQWQLTSAVREPAIAENPMRVACIIENIGVVDAFVFLNPVQPTGFTATAGIKIYPAGAITIDKDFPWQGAIEIEAPGSVEIAELVDGGA